VLRHPAASLKELTPSFSLIKLDGICCSLLLAVLPLARIFPCSKEILVLARNLQGNEIYKEMARKNTKIKGYCKDFCNLYQLQV
jgi:hypothetical protein